MKATLKVTIIFYLVVTSRAVAGSSVDKYIGIYIKLYQNYASPIRANYAQCGFYPSCSHYAKQAFDDYGLIKGMMMTGDRLMRCHPNLAYSRYWGVKNDRRFDPPQFEAETRPTIDSNDTNNILLDIPELAIRYPWINKVIIDGEYELAIVKLKEIFYFNAIDSSEAAMINYLLGWLHEQVEHTNEAICYYQKATFSAGFFPIAQLSFQRLADIYLHDMNLSQLQIDIEKQIHSQNHPFCNELLRWKYLCYIGSGDFDNGSGMLKEQSNFNSPEEFNKIVTEFKKGPPGSPLLVGISGVILPGSGYLIGGEFKDAVSAFITNFLLIGGTIQLIQNKSYLGATFLGMFTLPFYLGNIYGGINTIKLKQANWRQQKLIEMKILLEL